MKAILGYDIDPGLTAEEYDEWLFTVHAPDLLANPYLDRIVFNTVLGPVRQTSGGSADVATEQTFYRIAELHFADEDAYAEYRKWFDENPIPAGRGPAGRSVFRFYVLATPLAVDRDNLAEIARAHAHDR